MANSYVEYTTGGTGTNQLGQTTFTVPTNFININDINAKGFNGSVWTALTISSRATNTITLSATPTAGSYSKLRVYRQTSTDPLVDFVDGARLTESDLDAAYRQGLFAAQEVSEDAAAVGTTLSSVTGLTLGGTTTVDNLTATGTVTLPNSSISNDNLAGSIASSKLAEYATGSFTLVGNSDMTISSSKPKGMYTRIGNICFLQFYVNFTHSGGATVTIDIPFQAAADLSDGSEMEATAVVHSNTSVGHAGILLGYIGSGSQNIIFYKLGASGLVQNSDFPSTGELYVNINYRIA